MMKKIRKTVAWLMTAFMVICVIATNPIPAKAADKTFVLKISCAEGLDVPNNYNVEYSVVDADGGNPRNAGVLNGSADGSQVSQSFSVTDADYVKIRVQSAGRAIFFGGQDQTDTWSTGQVIAVNALADEYQFQLQQPQNQGGQGGDNPGGQGGDNPPPTTEEDVNLTVEWSGQLSDIKVGNQHLDPTTGNSFTFTKADCQSNGNIHIEIYPEFPGSFNSVKINGVEKLSGDQTVESYSFDIEKTTTTLKIDTTIAAMTKHTIVWAYDNEFGDDALVQNGKVEVVSGAENHGERHYVANDGDAVTIKLIPDYGYQVVGAKINGVVDLAAGENQNEFTFNMPATNVHFKGIFTKTEDIVDNSSTSVSAATFDGSAVASNGGTAKMTVTNADPSDITCVTEEIDETKEVQAVDISMAQLFYKNSADSMWTTNKTELGKSSQISLTVNQEAAGYAVVKEHEGNTSEVAATYDPATKKVTFASSEFSTYTLVPLKVSNNNYVPEETKQEDSTPTSIVTGSNDNVTVEDEKEEVVRDIRTVSSDKTAVTKEIENKVPADAYNMSSYKTVKGFVTGINKIANNQTNNNIKIYTDKPICFSKYILNEIGKKNIEYYFMYEGHLYCVTIPAGTQPERVLEKNGFAGPLYIGKVLGTTRLIM